MATSFELQELEPSPVEETPPVAGKESYFPAPLQRSSTLGLSGHRAPYYLLRAQRYSSYIFSAFAVAHISNTAIIPLVTRSIQTSNTYLLLTRPYYQSWPIAEPLLVLLPLTVHIGSGLALRLYRRRALVKSLGAESHSDRKTIPWAKVSGTSALGLTAAALVAGHTALTRLLPWLVEGGSSGIGLDYVGHGVALDYPGSPHLGRLSLDALVLVTVAHMTWGWAKWLGLSASQATGATTTERRLAHKKRWWSINGIVAVVSTVWMAGGVGIVGRGGTVPGWVGKAYDQIYKACWGLGRFV